MLLITRYKRATPLVAVKATTIRSFWFNSSGKRNASSTTAVKWGKKARKLLSHNWASIYTLVRAPAKFLRYYAMAIRQVKAPQNQMLLRLPRLWDTPTRIRLFRLFVEIMSRKVNDCIDHSILECQRTYLERTCYFSCSNPTACT